MIALAVDVAAVLLGVLLGQMFLCRVLFLAAWFNALANSKLEDPSGVSVVDLLVAVFVLLFILLSVGLCRRAVEPFL